MTDEQGILNSKAEIIILHSLFIIRYSVFLLSHPPEYGH